MTQPNSRMGGFFTFEASGGRIFHVPVPEFYLSEEEVNTI